MSTSDSKISPADPSRGSSELLAPGEAVPAAARPLASGPQPAPPVLRPAPPPPSPPEIARIPEAPGHNISKGRLVAAFGIAVVSDLISVWTQFLEPMQLTVDITTAALLFMVLGWRWPLLIGLFMEAVPGLAFVPSWVMVVGAIAVWGTVRPSRT